MHHALLIDRDPAEGLRLASAWAAAGDRVTVVLVADAAAASRPGHDLADALAETARAGVAVAAHDEALDCRGIDPPAEGVKRISLDELADLVADGADRAVWL